MIVASPDATVRKVMRRLLPLAMLLVLFNLIDRTNISFAALQMNADLGFTPSVYGLAAGIFFIGYFLFEVPSNLVLVRVGARPWLARIMISWGVVVLGMAWMRGTGSFYSLRFVLGVAEAGLLPGVLLYLSRWIPSRQLGLAFSFLMSATAIANVVSGPIAGALMQADGLWGLRGWQLMFVAEGIATILIGVGVLVWLPERPADARWLGPDERAWLAETLAREERQKVAAGATSLRQAFVDRRVLLATLVCFLFVCCNFGTVFWLPQIVSSLKALTPVQIGFVTAVPYLLGGTATVLWGRHSDRTRDRKWHLVGGALLATLGYAWAGVASANGAAFLGLCVATIGIWSMFGVFWGHAGDLLGGAATAAGFAFINSFSTLGGFVGPVLMGFVRERTQSFSGSLLVLAVFAVLTAGAALLIENVQRGHSPEATPLPT
jgi:MFS transporter, ACS family, tartrate transporter